MRRKVIKQKSAYTLTLPVDWIRAHNVKGKDEVEIEQEADTLIIRTEKQATAKETALTLEQSSSHYNRIMIENHYLKGFDKLNLTFEKKAFPAIQKAVSNLISFEIIDQKEGSCIVAATTPATAEQFKTLFNRCFNIISYTAQQVTEDIKKGEFSRFEEIEAQTNDARRFLLYCTRALHKTSIVPREEESFLHLLLERLILIQHNHFYLYKKICTTKKQSIRKDVIKLYEESCKMFSQFREMFNSKKLIKFAAINKKWEQTYFKDGHALLKGCTKEESIIIYHAMHQSKLVFLIAQPNLILQKV